MSSMQHDDESQEDRALRDALTRLPRHSAPAELKARLAARYDVASTSAGARPRARSARNFGFAFAAAIALLVVGAAFVRRTGDVPSDATAQLVTEATNDHLRILYGEHPLEVASGGIHQVKPWFAGKLDFAPVIAFEGDDEFPLQGGAVAYFVDRKAAAFVYKRRLHTLSLFVFRAAGLPWPQRGLEPIGRVKAQSSNERGFHVLMWRDGELGYALVSDVDPRDMRELAAKLAGP